MTFQAIDTQLVLDTAINSARKAGLDLDLKHHGKGIFKGAFGDTIQDPSGSPIRPMLFLKNINDGGHAFMITVGLLRSVCSNGLVVGDAAYTQRIIHREGPTMNDFLMNLDNRLSNAFEISADQFTDKLTDLANSELTTESGIHIIGSLALPEGIKDYAVHYWVNPTRIEDSGRNLYSLYNVVNEMNRRRSSSATSELNREISLLGDIEALYAHEQFIQKVA